MITHLGGCHCGRVRFEVDAPAVLQVDECNCSMCTKKANIHLIVTRDRFTLLRGAESITTYRFNTGVAQHTFCSVCGIHPFYTPRSHPDCVDVNVRCLDGDVAERFRIVPFDGKHWEDSVATIR